VHKTKTGRWHPDAPRSTSAPVAPEALRLPEPTYELFLYHRYNHQAIDHGQCPFCLARYTPQPAAGSPFDLISGLDLRDHRA